jgi:hypothetical protein
MPRSFSFSFSEKREEAVHPALGERGGTAL